jgi:hypothetical protein
MALAYIHISWSLHNTLVVGGSCSLCGSFTFLLQNSTPSSQPIHDSILFIRYSSSSQYSSPSPQFKRFLNRIRTEGDLHYNTQHPVFNLHYTIHYNFSVLSFSFSLPVQVQVPNSGGGAGGLQLYGQSDKLQAQTDDLLSVQRL